MRRLCYLYSARFLIVYLLVAFLVGISFYKKKHSGREASPDYFKFWAEKLHVPADANGRPENIRRRQQAVDMLSNGVLDKCAIIQGAGIRHKPRQYQSPRSVRNDPELFIIAVDESNQIGFISYSESDDPNAFGDTMFSLHDHRLLFGAWSSFDSHPVYYWNFYLKGYDDIRFELLKNQYIHYSSWAVLEVLQAKFDSLAASRGQIILYDREHKVLDRYFLSPLDGNELPKFLLDEDTF